MKANIKSLLLCLSIITYCSCSENYEEENSNKSSILEITTGIQTRSVIESTSFSGGEQIGVYASDTEGEDYAEGSWNMKAVYNNKWYFDNPLILSEQKATIYAYYPYNEKATIGKSTFVNITPNVYEAIGGQADYLYGQGEADATYPTAKITFKHALARITFAIKRDKNDAGNGVLNKITLRNALGKKTISTTGTMDITTGTITPNVKENASVILSTNYTLNNSTEQKVDILVIPTEITEGDVELVLTIDEGLYVIKMPATKWEKGQQYTYPIIINRTDAHMGEITKAQIGDYYYKDGTWSTEYNSQKVCIGIIFALSDEKDGDINISLKASEHGRIVALNDIEGDYLWIDRDYIDVEGIPNYSSVDGYIKNGYLPHDGNDNYQTEKEHIQPWNLNSWPEINGKYYAFTDYTGRQHNSYLKQTDYPAALNCDSSRDGFWYLPSIGEMARLGMAYSAGLISSVKQDNFSNFHEVDYWTSSEYNEEMAWRYNPSNAYVGQYNKKSRLRVRPVSSF
ncbi:fimbrillin family protein [Bacteroides faecium]|uniref:DUF1566 domain-containing protein n=1 Tax=Bacteroides faecium TaxID=2715212 RepID=A0A6H0KJZ7_9BACE|nr:fimbrillin family protein [Bacteroides faecium]QIU92888.1 DUF1566 domain-containing protein [Bacteroides faecium]